MSVGIKELAFTITDYFQFRFIYLFIIQINLWYTFSVSPF